MRCPESSPLGTNPRAPERATSGPKSEESRLETRIRKPDPKRPNASPKDRPMTPEVILRELGKIHIGDILLETTEGQQLTLRRIARPDAEQKRILTALGLDIPERLSPDHLL